MKVPFFSRCLLAVLAFTQATGLSQVPSSERPPLPAVAMERALQGQAAIAALGDELPAVASHHRLTADRLRELLAGDSDLWIDREGRLFYADSHVPQPALGPASTESPVASAALVPLDQTFLLHSRPSAPRKVFLDFDGHTTTGTSWRDVKDGDSTFVTPPYDFDGVPNSFSATELERIQYIWQRVAEDFAPFDVDITTQDPGVEGLRKTSSSDPAYGIRVCIGGASTDWYSTSGYGGVAYIGSFDWSSDTPCYVWENNLGNGNEKYVAEAVSHEVGHTLDLYHDGTSTAGYYQGHGSGADGWAPIMGVGYYKPVVQFSKGEYLDANNTEDDLSKITAAYNTPYIVDDHGNAFTTATPLGSGTVAASGLIERTSDVDFFTFVSGSGPLSITIAVDARSPNLNVEAKLYDASGTLVAVSSPPLALGAEFEIAALSAGTYFMTVDGVGSGNPLDTGYSDYGSLGIYTIQGTIPASGYPVASASYTFISSVPPFQVAFSSSGSFDPDGGLLSYDWDFGNGQSSTDANPVVTYADPGDYLVTLTVTDDEGSSSSASLTVSCVDPFTPPAAPSGLTAKASSSSQINLKWTDNAADETGFHVERASGGGAWVRVASVSANQTSYSATGLSPNTSYSFRVQAYSTVGVSAYSNTASAKTRR